MTYPASQVILNGLATNSCVLFTAGDAYMRDLEIAVPLDCVAACDCATQQSTLTLLQDVLKADITVSEQIEIGTALSGRKY